MKQTFLTILSLLALTTILPVSAEEFPKGSFPDGTTAILLNGKWQLSPPTIAFQEEELLAEEEELGSELGRLYHIRNLMTGGTIYGGSLHSLQETIDKAATLNEAENTSFYYVSIGTRY